MNYNNYPYFDNYFNYQNNLINSFDNNYNYFQHNIQKNNSIENSTINNMYNNKPINGFKDSRKKENCSAIVNPNEPIAMYKLFKNPIKHILFINTFLSKINNNNLLKKMEFYYFKNELCKKDIDIYNFLNGCLDCIKYINDSK